MSFSIYSSRKPRFPWRHWFEQSFRSYMTLNCNFGTKIKKENGGKILSDYFGRKQSENT